MIPVEEAQALCLDGLSPLPTETLPLVRAAGRILARPERATRPQPPFASSAMDGYAVRSVDLTPGARLAVVGEAPAGHAWDGTLGPGEALRIFTGAPLPNGADQVVIQEDTARNGDEITIVSDPGDNLNIRPQGADFPQGFELTSPRRLGPSELALLAAMNVANVHVYRAPEVALLATGDELVMPGGAPRDDQIIASNIFALSSMIEAAGGRPRILPIAADTEEALAQSFALTEGADVVVTIGGASVGDHDLVGPAASAWGVERQFYKIAMRPGKPLMSGRIAGRPFLGLPGNPVSAIVCGHLFLLPVLRRLMGDPEPLPRPRAARLAAPVRANGPRAHYMRARLDQTDSGPTIRSFDRQDSSLLTVLSEANALLIRPPHAPAADAGEAVTYLPLAHA
ncbi:molybdopterin molybdotransferase MoeA [Ponticoccus sp. SC2-23]|uniref:molybdopterin molybdotransferase MoeA n=1 Tax=Alexandriicola marinus TaxID=2081710 RepID=UPI000FD70C78|nr:gephyrin-like molybdotransferase Glp [Alexandriicola marinus]MBM1219240.1 molybdopterin molybdotransferase MoeA [Ponticoccus sp. SC6-9]MBM1223688.1 molybdopterin molybdotransferase MoeA [Ponticoccus sp. SC6-15]MBM1229053.1 molybdopterin molybdotransferase MoeA [Ponticoccus sp. SC6-38]MBM1232654.1 molybdopterin molybdotransferase MoeA [Ponticoccus sp. SC6-45]MBM1237396.1 molybdopterin molybdotransferase MoeA [Ponticoccus sp. SC6-49]MBM1241665.1 molybdopterin molybdotransferase MoeA [Pontico